MLASQAAQDELWTAVLALKFTSMELNIIYSYVIEVLICLHTRVLEKLPDLVRGLPTLASVLRRKAKNKCIRGVWESVLEECGLQEGDILALCTFFIAHGNKAEHYSAKVRRVYIRDATFMVTNMVKNRALQDSLLRAVQLIDKGKAVAASEEQKSSLKELIPTVKN
ncbi:single-pass membrane and coiled-coil domain-containing protein 1 [Pteronotus mesoamericanus]|uniref:single-pass membrane and coiled-coil domain-containing protein 1 n=1 Tax=Pteronotus mesoamericanus TaxID=1884717 RepID=UPI0023ED4FFB|nr:single-pass membrane and coiled-coil domain-containing protein 1 [Pteronotus parnellii mesoamericanus]